MKLFENKTANEAMPEINDLVATAIADKVIRLKQFVATRMGTWFNAFSISQKKWILVSLGLLISTVLITGLFGSVYSVPQIKQPDYNSAHIGQASGLPQSQTDKRQLTDSLNLKK